MQINKKLQPKSFNAFVGQNKLIKTLKIMIKSAENRSQNCDHILLYGRPGFGKTTLATLIANNMKSNIRIIQGPLLEKKSDILSMFATIESGDVLFIDEIHGINKFVEELLYTSIEEGVVDVPIGVDGETKFMRMNLPKFTMVGATTKLHLVSTPLKDRFGLVAKLNEYSHNEIKKIIMNSFKNLGFSIKPEEVELLVEFSGLNPRKSNMLIKRCLDFKTNADNQIIRKDIIRTLSTIGIYRGGLNQQHIEYLLRLNNGFQGGWTSLETISGSLMENKKNLEKNIEPQLLVLKYINKSSKGRKITETGKVFLRNYNKID